MATTITDTSLIASLNRGPITSVFQQPTSCLATLTYNGDKSALYWGHFASQYIDFACYPKPTVRENPLVTVSSWDNYWYSPAICPQGWHTEENFQTIMPGNDDSVTIVPLGNDTTAALCCPTSYRYYGSGGRQCISDLKEGQVIQYINPKNNGQGFDRAVTTSQIVADTTVYGDGVPIWWQSSDSAVLAAAAVTMTPTETGIPTTALNSAPTSTSSVETSETSIRGLSAGAKIGIGIAIPLFVIAIATITLLLFRIRKQNRAAAHTPSDFADVPLHGQDKPYIQNYPQELYAQPAELFSQQQAYDRRHELPE